MANERQQNGGEVSLEKTGELVLEERGDFEEVEDSDVSSMGSVSPEYVANRLGQAEDVGVAYSGPLAGVEHAGEYGAALSGSTDSQAKGVVSNPRRAAGCLEDLIEGSGGYCSDDWFDGELPRPSNFSTMEIDEDEAALEAYEVSDNSGNQFTAYLLSGVEMRGSKSEAESSEYAFIVET